MEDLSLIFMKILSGEFDRNKFYLIFNYLGALNEQ